MTNKLKQNLPVLTADESKLGRTHTVYHREETEKLDFDSYLMVVNMTIGAESYVPMT